MKNNTYFTVLLSITLFCIGCTDREDERTASAEPLKANVTGAKALVETTKLAESGDPVAQSKLGDIYAQGLEVPQDFVMATSWFSKAAEQGYAEAQYYLGVIYSGGFVASPDFVEGYVWFCLAAQSGFEIASEDCDVIASKLSSEELVAAEARIAKLLEKIQKQKIE